MIHMPMDSRSPRENRMGSRFDVVVIGGGVVGMSCAHYLQLQGASVCIVDRGRYTEGASTGNAGMIVPSHIIPLSAPGVIAKGMKWLMNPESPLYIKPSANPKFMKWLWLFQKHCTEEHVRHAVPILRDMSIASRDLLTEMCSLEGFSDVGLEHDGLLMLHNSEKAAKDNEELAVIAAEAGLEIETLDRDGTLALEPALKSDLTGSVFFRQDASIHPERLLRALESSLVSRGVTFMDGEITKLGKSGNRLVHATGTMGEIAADHFVIAAGSWTPHLVAGLGLQLPVQPAKGYSVTVPAPDSKMRIPCVLTDEKLTITPMPGCVRFGGTLALQGFDDSIDERRARPLRRQAEKYFSPETVASVKTWSGFRPASPDGLPYIDAVPKINNAFVASGHGMMGVTLGPVTGKLIAELISGIEPTLDMSSLKADRH